MCYLSGAASSSSSGYYTSPPPLTASSPIPPVAAPYLPLVYCIVWVSPNYDPNRHYPRAKTMVNNFNAAIDHITQGSLRLTQAY